MSVQLLNNSKDSTPAPNLSGTLVPSKVKNDILTSLYVPAPVLFTKFRYLVISDVHLGNQRNPLWRMIANLRAYFGDFKDVSQFATLDVLFIAGDLFDKALWFTNDDLNLIFAFFLDLFDFCERHGIAFRYLEGTPSHDRKQFRNIVPLASKFPALDFRYIEEMCVEAFYDHGITCLYVPDEHAGGGEKSQALIKTKLDELGIEKVSIGMVHSWFKYQVPEVSSSSKYDEEFFLSIVEYFVSNGHIHGPSTFDRIVGQGSFDRVAHNEEHAKGGVLFEINDKDAYFFFLENKNALPFRTVHVKTTDMEKAVEQIDKVASKLPEMSWLRIKAKEINPVLHSLDALGKQYPLIRFEKITEEEEARTQRKTLVDDTAFQSIDYKNVELVQENIVGSIMEEMDKRQFLYEEAILKPLLEAVL